MEPITVKRHGRRWAVHETSGTAPAREYDTLELAETAARQLGSETGRDVVVDESAESERLGVEDEPRVEDHDAEPGMRPRIGPHTREPQPGL